MYRSGQDQGQYFHRAQDRQYAALPAKHVAVDTPIAAHLPPQVYASANTFLPSQVPVCHQKSNPSVSVLYRTKIANTPTFVILSVSEASLSLDLDASCPQHDIKYLCIQSNPPLEAFHGLLAGTKPSIAPASARM